MPLFAPIIDPTYLALAAAIAVSVLVVIAVMGRDALPAVRKLFSRRLRFRLLHLCIFVAICACVAKAVSLVDWSFFGRDDAVLLVGAFALVAIVVGNLIYMCWDDYFSPSRKLSIPPKLPETQQQESAQQRKPVNVRFKISRQPTSRFKW